jgi:glyoxylase-like metal-dependent hydrolase (beta-lactamase superfamily II)
MTVHALATLAGVSALTVVLATPIADAPQEPNYDVHAVRFAHVSYPVSSLVRGAERGRDIDIAFTVWVMRAANRVVLLDAGFYREKFITRWKPMDFVTPAEAVQRGLGIAPQQVTDIVISHSHWDHVDGADLFPRATVWIQKEEYDYYVGPQGEVLHTGGADADDAKMLAELNKAGRVQLVDGDAKDILPGITVYTGGKHTFASQFAGVKTTAGTVVLASDNAYLYENLEKKLPIAQTLDAASNLKAQERMLALAASPSLVIPGHDPAVFERFPVVAPGVVKISR